MYTFYTFAAECNGRWGMCKMSGLKTDLGPADVFPDQRRDVYFPMYVDNDTGKKCTPRAGYARCIQSVKQVTCKVPGPQ